MSDPTRTHPASSPIETAPPLPDHATLPRGFVGAATACGLKASGALDLALIAAERAVCAAGVFTTNRVKAAPVLHDQDVLLRGADRVRAVIANSGCANACTGEPGLADARAMAALTAQQIGCAPDQVLVLSTGVIGRRLDMEAVARGIVRVAAARSTDATMDVARAIMTTDTRPKLAACSLDARGGPIAITGFAKGAGMIHPHMATMLAVVLTDAAATPARLEASLAEATRRSFNRVSVDGDMSTNDTVLLLASGASGVEIGAADAAGFTAALTEVCASLARQIARDGEGATRLVAITITGAGDEGAAHRVADAIARSPLVKSAIHGGDPNWGRILAAAGACGEPIDPARLSLAFGAPAEEIRLVGAGLPLAFDERAASASLRRDPVEIRLDLGGGAGAATVWTCDLSAEYVAINAHYTT